MKEKIMKTLLYVIGGSLTAIGVTGLGKVVYVKGKVDAYKEISNDLNSIIDRHKNAKVELAKEESK